MPPLLRRTTHLCVLHVIARVNHKVCGMPWMRQLCKLQQLGEIDWAEIIRGWSLPGCIRHRRLFYIHPLSQGDGTAINVVMRARGEYTTMCDGQISWNPSTLVTCKPALERDSTCLRTTEVFTPKVQPVSKCKCQSINQSLYNVPFFKFHVNFYTLYTNTEQPNKWSNPSPISPKKVLLYCQYMYFMTWL